MNLLAILRLGVSAGVILFIPGYILKTFLKWRRSDPINDLARVFGLSISTYAIIASGLFFFKVQINSTVAYTIITALLAVSLVRFIQTFSPRYPIWQYLLTIGFVGTLITWRLFQARTLVLPAWIDSPHHALIVRKILDTGGLFEDLSPYIPTKFYYHFAFHVVTAIFSWLGDIEPDQAILLFGQVLNALIGLSSYRLTKVIMQDWRPAIIVALLISFFSQMPAYYLSWGRYTLLTGLILLPLVMATIIESMEKPVNKGTKFALGMMTAGVIFSHYFAAFLLLEFIILFLSYNIWLGRITNETHRRNWQELFWGLLIGIGISLPWMARVWGLAEVLGSIEITAMDFSYFGMNPEGYREYLWQLAGPARGYFLIGLASLGAYVAFRIKRGIPIALWAILLALQSLPLGLQFGPLRPDHFVIVLFLPASILAGFIVKTLWEGLQNLSRWDKFLSSGAKVFLAGLFFWGSIETANIINPSTIVATNSDRAALEWIKINTNLEDRFFINTTHWQQGNYRGVDGGIWILPITGRWTLIPTVAYSFGDRELVSEISNRAEIASRFSKCNDEFWDFIIENKISFIYIKVGHGSLQPSGLARCEVPSSKHPWLNRVYQSDKIFIYKTVTL